MNVQSHIFTEIDKDLATQIRLAWLSYQILMTKRSLISDVVKALDILGLYYPPY